MALMPELVRPSETNISNRKLFIYRKDVFEQIKKSFETIEINIPETENLKGRIYTQDTPINNLMSGDEIFLIAKAGYNGYGPNTGKGSETGLEAAIRIR